MGACGAVMVTVLNVVDTMNTVLLVGASGTVTVVGLNVFDTARTVW